MFPKHRPQPYCKGKKQARQRGRLNPKATCTIAVCVITRARALKVHKIGSTPNAIRGAILAVACQLMRLRLPGSRFCKFIV